SQAYFPWGETKGTSNPQDTWNFATYWQDSNTGLDYANNRYYSNAYGRFMTPDPYTAGGRGSGNPSDPQSWNRYAYTRGDPVNRFDPNGTDDSGAGDGGDSGDPSGGDTSSFTCDTSWESDASLVGIPCGIQVPGPYGGMVYINVAAIAAAAIAAAQTAAQTAQTNCENTETAWLSNYLSQRGSPLAAFAGSIVSQSDAAGVDDRFIAALAGAESTYGKNTSATWGQYNAWSDSQHCAILSGDCQAVNPFSSWSQAISAAIGNITGKNYFGANPSLTTTDSIYKRYSNGASPSLLNTIYLNQMGGGLIPGNPKEVDFARCP
ncbi:MAG: RHS repeat-associated core domain-containing protein, partial [Bryobacteraceae bacterium]